MGYVRHHAILITSYDLKRIHVAFEHAIDYCGQCSPIMISRINNWYTIVIPTDGSEEGWEESNKGDACRAKMIRWLDSKRHSDGSRPYSWVEVQYGDDDGQSLIVSHSEEKHRTTRDK